jgi:hypothetical protein
VSESLRLGTLGSAATFAGEAASRFVELHPERIDTVYLPSVDAVWQALERGAVDAIVIGIERNGQPHEGRPLVLHPWYVLDQISLPIACNLYVKPGTRRESIRKITGHGSIQQCEIWLERNFPGIPREVHPLNSVEAARDVLAGDGSMAVVGSRSLPRVVSGLDVFEASIDDGATANWWAIAARPRFVDAPTGVVVTGRFGPDGTLGGLIGAMLALGQRLRAAGTFPVKSSGALLYDYILSFSGPAVPLTRIQTAAAAFPMAHLSGAFVRTD